MSKIICIKTPIPNGRYKDLMICPKENDICTIRGTGQYELTGTKYYLIEEVKNEVMNIRRRMIEPGFPMDHFALLDDWNMANALTEELLEEAELLELA